MAKNTIKTYVVHRNGWNYDDEVFFVEGQTPLKTFINRNKAEEYRMELERTPGTRCFDNPFEVVGMSLEEWTSLSKEELDEGLRKLGLTPPQDDDYYGWWSGIPNRRINAQVLNGVYELLDRVHFFEIVEMEVELES